MPTTIEWWDVDGVSLNEHGWNVKTLSGRLGAAPLRGEDKVFSGFPGEEWSEKLPASRVLTLAMWTVGTDRHAANEIASYDTDQTLAFNDNYDFLRSLFWQPSRQFLLTRRWLTRADDGTATVQVATALGQYVSGLDAEMTGRTRADFVVDIKLADPFFYGVDSIQTDIALGDTVTVHNPGHYVSSHRNMWVALNGPLSNPVLTNLTPNPDVKVSYAGTITAGQTITLDVGRFTAVAAQPELSYKPVLGPNRVSKISHSGAKRWMGLLRGDNQITLTADAHNPANGTPGNAVVRFRPPYL